VHVQRFIGAEMQRCRRGAEGVQSRFRGAEVVQSNSSKAQSIICRSAGAGSQSAPIMDVLRC